MARYTGPTERISRRAGQNLFLKGERSTGPKSAMTRRPYAPGQHGGGKRQPKVSEYGQQLREKQKAKAIYGILERQFRNYYDKAARTSEDTGAKLLQLLETRLDNIVFRLGFADSRRQARQYVTHGHVTVNGKKQSVPSCQVSPKSTIALRGINRTPTQSELPVWVTRKGSTLEGEFLARPDREQISTELEEQRIVEFYSR